MITENLMNTKFKAPVNVNKAQPAAVNPDAAKLTQQKSDVSTSAKSDNPMNQSTSTYSRIDPQPKSAEP